MNGVIEIIGGNFKGISCTAYISKEYTCNKGALNYDLLDKDCCFICISDAVNVNLCKVASSPNNDSFLRLHLNSPFADIDSIRLNVPIEITATFGVFGWTGFFLFRMYKKLKGWF